MPSATQQRNEKIRAYMERCFSEAQKGNFTDDSEFTADLNLLFSSGVWGFREITLVIAIAKYLNSSYLPTTNLYSCKPRALYEGPMRTSLIEHNIPHRKSGPLNIAKAAVGLNKAWAAQRDDRKVADAVVRLASFIEAISPEKLENFIIALHKRFLDESTRIEEIPFEFDILSDANFLTALCYHLINKAPDIGNTPQRIVGLLMKAFHENINSPVIISGYDQRASVTSTTSHKPGDVNEESPDGTIYSVYEITVKPFRAERMKESYDTITSYNNRFGTAVDEVKVICRPEDIPNDLEGHGQCKMFLGTTNYKGIDYTYINLYEWISALLVHLTKSGRRAFYDELAKYIADINTAEFVKLVWAKFHSEVKAE